MFTVSRAVAGLSRYALRLVSDHPRTPVRRCMKAYVHYRMEPCVAVWNKEWVQRNLSLVDLRKLYAELGPVLEPGY